MDQNTSFQSVLKQLLDPKKEIPVRHLQLLSDMDLKSLDLFIDSWKTIKPEKKLLLLGELLTLYDSDNLVSFDELAKALLDDLDGEVRSRAIRLLFESDDFGLVTIFIGILLNDVDLAPRLEAATALGGFIELGELEEIPEELHHQAEDALIKIANSDENPSLRRRAVEALGYSSRPEVEKILTSAFSRQDPTWVVSALFAMGRSGDTRWTDEVMSKLLDADPRIRLVAAEAAGNMYIEEASPILINMLEEEEDDDVTSAAIWALSQIGGEDARIYIQNLLDLTEDEDAAEFLESALENLDFNDQINKFDFLSLDEDDESEDEYDEDEK